MQIVIAKDGTVRHIYSDELAELLGGNGEARTVRASHVEPDGSGGWTADMSPMDGPLLGPFKTRREALEEEVKWLEAHNSPTTR